ncbi:hypothetical protein AGLY_017079 [Aphis glycines]|uniref:Uncharacterized protein n=1 Tax=Aphis glycines TaxID=307491 RepID=A0A6G0SVY1_APHGL|nr:hypothetical protein AGLY_017079 [Aphis glycines]
MIWSTFRFYVRFAVFVFFFLLCPIYDEKLFWELLTFNGYEHQGHSICSRKPPSMFVIGAFFRLNFLNIDCGRIRVLCDLSFSVVFFLCFIVIYYENCWEMFTFNGYKHQGHSICSRKPPSKFVIGVFFRLVMLYKETKKKILFKYRFGRIPVLCKICRFRSFFFSFMSIIMKTVGKCSLLTVSRIKDIRFAVENHPQNLPFSVIFFFVYLNYFENCWEMFTFNGYKHQGHSICSRKPPSNFVIGAFFRLVMFWEMFTFNGYTHQGHSICSRKLPSKFVIGAFFRLVMLYKETKKKISGIYK